MLQVYYNESYDCQWLELHEISDSAKPVLVNWESRCCYSNVRYSQTFSMFPVIQINAKDLDLIIPSCCDLIQNDPMNLGYSVFIKMFIYSCLLWENIPNYYSVNVKYNYS